MSARSNTRKTHTAQDGVDVIVVERITVRDKITEAAKDLTGKVSGDRGPGEDPNANNRWIDRRGCVFAEHRDKKGPRSRGPKPRPPRTASPAATALR